ncbi:hypothetical protein ES705_45819 [subsurface metagenome]
MNKAKQRYDSKYKVTRINLSDYLALKRISQVSGISMSEALHRLIEHQAQLPLLDMAAQPIVAMATKPISGIVAKPKPAIRVAPVTTVATVAPVTTVATNGNKGVAFRIKSKGARYGAGGIKKRA